MINDKTTTYYKLEGLRNSELCRRLKCFGQGQREKVSRLLRRRDFGVTVCEKARGWCPYGRKGVLRSRSIAGLILFSCGEFLVLRPWTNSSGSFVLGRSTKMRLPAFLMFFQHFSSMFPFHSTFASWNRGIFLAQEELSTFANFARFCCL